MLAHIAADQEAEEGKSEYSIGFLSSLPTFIHSVAPAHKMVPPTFKADSTSSVNSIWKNPERHIQRYIFTDVLSVGLSLNQETMDVARLAG